MKRFTWKTWRVAALFCGVVLTMGIGAAPAAEILFIGANPQPDFGDDGFVFDYLTDVLEHDVTYVAAVDSTTADGEEVDLIILSSTPGSGDMRGKFNALPTPILNWEEAIMDGTTAAGNFAMGAGAENGSAAPGMEIEILDPTHPLAAGLSGIVEFSELEIANPYMTGPLGPDVLPIATFPQGEVPDFELSPSGTGMHIGSNQNAGAAFVGLMDEVALWDSCAFL